MLLGVVSWRQTFLMLGVVFGAAFIVVALRTRAAPADMRLAFGPGPRHLRVRSANLRGLLASTLIVSSVTRLTSPLVLAGMIKP
jgi:hypothetical protein